MYDLLAGPQVRHWTEGQHVDVCDQEPQVAEASAVVATHLDRYLGADGRDRGGPGR